MLFVLVVYMNFNYMNKEEVEKILLGKTWKFAKTMKSIPHSYTLEMNWDDKDLFKKVAEYIKENGETEYFWGKPFKYYYFGGYKYWAMKIKGGTGIINRAQV